MEFERVTLFKYKYKNTDLNSVDINIIFWEKVIKP